ncbi:uncharacterized protein DS421_6g185750 [Arachis hypogaea]|nr:uncharacterized protein DS421_6g185750 [Arachis hypogaea]
MLPDSTIATAWPFLLPHSYSYCFPLSLCCPPRLHCLHTSPPLQQHAVILHSSMHSSSTH